jgi:hypothetical protein
MARLTQDDIQPVMDLLDLLRDVRTALADMGNAEWGENELARFDVFDGASRPVCFTHRLPPEVVTAGLCAMEKEVQALLQARDIQVVELS